MKCRRPKLGIIPILCLAVILFFAAVGYPQGTEIAKYPSRPITYIIPTPPGSESDVPCRLIAKEAEKFLGQPIIVVNKPGGSFTIGIAAMAAAKPDGYTIGHTGTPGMFFTPFLEKLPYHPVNDIKMIMQFGDINLGMLVKADSPFKRFEDIITYARKNPKKLTYGVGALGSMGHLIMEQIAKREKVQFTMIPFKGSPETQSALLGGHVQVVPGGFNYSLIEAGATRVLLLLGEKRSDEFPQVPILRDIGYDIPVPAMLTVAGPKGIPDGIVRKLEEAFTKAMREPAFINGMKSLHLNLLYRNNKELDDYVARAYEFYGKLIKEMGFVSNQLH